MSKAPDPRDFVTVPGAVTIDGLTAEQAGWLVRRPEFRALRIAARGAHPAVSAYLMAVTAVGEHWCSSQSRTPVPNTREQPTESTSWVTSAEAARLLDIDIRGVQMAVKRGRIDGTKVDGRLRVDRESLEHYRATRVA